MIPNVSVMLRVLLLLCVCIAMAEAKYKIYKDPKQPVSVRVEDLLHRMTLVEKIGKMVQIDRTNITAKKGSLSTRLGIPMIYGIDTVHGHNNVYKATIFPHNVGLGATRDPALVKRIGAATALEVRATGIPYAFTPCIAACRDPRWGRTKVVACAKHFVGDGGTTKGINENNTVIDWQGLLKFHMLAYLDSIRKGVATIMVFYSSWNGKKMHANYDLVTKYLKGTLGFKGFVISDWQGIDRITSPPHANYTYSVQTAIHAGLGMVRTLL
ncbi:unnamed protein product [Ilex paraguariensis]|uniref:beta-glucosidase n=1 Tax=Ilex paraguariensis TaxID=185542 RepID=A0ABC8SEX2_9AQUA